MEMSQVLHALVVVFSCLLLATVWCEDEKQGSQLEKRSVPAQDSFPASYASDDVMDKRGSLFRFGKRGSLFRFGKREDDSVDKRGSLFRFGKRGSLMRFGKRGSLMRFGKRGSLFRFGKRADDLADEWESYPSVYVSDDVKRTPLESTPAIKAFHWGRELEE